MLLGPKPLFSTKADNTWSVHQVHFVFISIINTLGAKIEQFKLPLQ